MVEISVRLIGNARDFSTENIEALINISATRDEELLTLEVFSHHTLA
jgi:hypothetical protein